MITALDYKTAMFRLFWRYVAVRPELHPYLDDKSTATLRQSAVGFPSVLPGRPPVFVRSASHFNVALPDGVDPEMASRVIAAMPGSERHRWHGSMSSSQAIAHSVFGYLREAGQLGLLATVECEDGLPLLGPLTAAAIDIDGLSLELEYKAPLGLLGEPRSTSVDVAISGVGYMIAIECKLMETEFGACSRPGLREHDANFDRDHCDGSLRPQRGRAEHCSLSAIGVGYWQHLPILTGWNAGADMDPCPLRRTYQLMRNVMVEVVREGEPTTEQTFTRGHAVVIYDERNPSFTGDGVAARQYAAASAALRDPKLLRRCSWQALVTAMRSRPELAGLRRVLEEKYGIRSMR